MAISTSLNSRSEQRAHASNRASLLALYIIHALPSLTIRPPLQGKRILIRTPK